MSLSELVCSAKCGESNTYSGIASNPVIGAVTDHLVQMGGTMLLSDTTELTGSEQLAAKRAASPAVAKRLLQAHRDYMAMIKAHGGGRFRSQPSRTNIKDGQTTIEEKGIGNLQKTGFSPVVA